MSDLWIMPPEQLPWPETLVVACPCCGGRVEYTPVEDDAGAFYAQQDWPTCEPCGVVVDVPPLRIVRAEGVFHADRRS